MRYLPDVMAYGFEELPDRNRFFASTVGLMRRWFGNMFRTSGRAIALGPRRMGLFTWWCIVDQRLSLWTTLIGPTRSEEHTSELQSQMRISYAVFCLIKKT